MVAELGVYFVAEGVEPGRHSGLEEHDDGKGVEEVIVIGEGGDVDADGVGILVDEGGEVGGPRAGDPGGAEEGIKEDAGSGEEGDEIAELEAEVGEGATDKGDLDDELGVAEDREEGGEADGDIGEGDGGAKVGASLLIGEDKDASADDGAEAEPDEIPLGEAVAEAMLALAGEGMELHDGVGVVEEAVMEAGAGVGKSGAVGGPVLERWLREEVCLALPSPTLLALTVTAASIGLIELGVVEEP